MLIDSEILIKCSICKESKNRDSFYKTRKDSGTIRRQCKECLKEQSKTTERLAYQQNYRNTNKERLKELGQAYRQTKKAWAARVYKNAITRATEKGLDFDLTIDWIIEQCPIKCAVLGIPLLPSSNDKNNSPSLDRFDNTKGYTKDNVKIISFRANKVKSDATEDELKAVLKYIKTRQK